uniref:Uncharacterized protein n=1 Tax=Ditylenchus dipsaci TaxID=166011 RepID=A0A915EKU2_9BILA
MDYIFRDQLHVVPSLLPVAPVNYLAVRTKGRQLVPSKYDTVFKYGKECEEPPTLLFQPYSLEPSHRYTIVKLKLICRRTNSSVYKQKCCWLIVNKESASKVDIAVKEYESGVNPDSFRRPPYVYRYLYLAYMQPVWTLNLSDEDKNFENWDLANFVGKYDLGTPIYGSGYLVSPYLNSFESSHRKYFRVLR